jgi:uncharacterized OsmC-like protein
LIQITAETARLGTDALACCRQIGRVADGKATLAGKGVTDGEACLMEYRVHARRIDSHGSLAVAKAAEVALDTDLAGRADAMNPVELLLSALAACMLKGIERVTPMLHFQIIGAEVGLEAERQDAPPKVTVIRYEIVVDSPETDQRLDLLHRNILKYGTISNTLAAAVPLEGTLRRKA